MPIDPFGLLGSAIANVVTDSLTAAMLALWNAGLWVLRAVLELEDAILTPSLGEDGPVGELYATTFWIALALVGIRMLVQVGVALGKRDGHSICRLLVGAAQFGFVWFAWVGYGVTLVAACSGLTKALMQSLLNVTRWSEWEPWEPFTASDITNGTVAVILGIMGMLLWLAAIGHTLVRWPGPPPCSCWPRSHPSRRPGWSPISDAAGSGSRSAGSTPPHSHRL